VKPDALSGATLGEHAVNEPTRTHQSRPASMTVVADVPEVPEWTEAAQPQPVDPPSLSPGTVIRDRFELVSVIGHGSTGVVYRALDRLHQEMEDRDPYVAIKVLRDDFRRHSNALVTLQREVRRAQTLAHENIVRVYSFERDGELVFMTMELLDGQSLRELIRHNADGLPAAKAVPMIGGIAAALAHAHKFDIVHSDLSPGNVYVTEDGHIKVLDFGVARGVQRETEADARTQEPYFDGARGLTPAYASPQMLLGKDPHPSDDVFALGILAHELLTGRHPFDGAPPDPDDTHIPDLRALAGLSRRQKKALRCAFAHDRELRHASAAEFLKEFLHSRKTRTATQIGVAALVVLGVVAVAALRDTGRPPAVAFEDLPAALRGQIDAAITEGRTALGFGDAGLNDAYEYFSQAYELHPDNTRARQGLQTVADRFLSSIRTLDVGTQRDILELLSCQEHLAAYGPVSETCTALFGEECVRIVQQCGTMRVD